jgi:FimV-like protein
VSDVDPAVDVFDLEKLEAQVREEEAGAFAQLLDRAMTSSGVGILAAILLAAAILLLLLRRRAAQQEQVLDDVLGNGDESEEVTPQEDPEPEGVTDLDEADEDVYTTRLKLAEAYLEMGDEDGAEGMLEEVIADGSPNQQEVARRILARLDAERTAQRPENGDD